MDSIGYKVNLNNHVDIYTMLDETVPLFFFLCHIGRVKLPI